jgi:glycosyltransferase involved in cell wall biosynthesis/ADP-heptose:LPS heptosyltransferase
MRIVIDMQGAQTESRFRGIGRYSLSLAQAIARKRGEHEVLLVLNGLFPHTIEPIRGAFQGLLPQENIRVWYALGPTRECDPRSALRRDAAELIREAFISTLSPDVVLVSSLFEGLGDDAVTSIGRFDVDTPVATVLYDLIPFINPDVQFQTNPIYIRYLDAKIDSVKRSAALLAISESSRQEALQALRFAPEQVSNVSAGCDLRFHRVEGTKEEIEALLSRLGIAKPYVMYTGGADERKNLPRLIQAFTRLPSDLRSQHQLVMVGKMPEGGVADLRQVAKDCGLGSAELIFTGYVDDLDLMQLYGQCRLFVFPSLHEGFGLPPLEAMACAAPVIAANATSLPEVVGREDAMFDPLSVESISRKMGQVLGDEAFRQDLIRYGAERVKQFSWDHSATKAIAAMERIARIPMVIETIGSVRQVATGLFKPQKKRILVSKLDHMGDLVLAIPAVMKLRARYPHACIDALVGSWNVEAASALGVFDHIYVLDFFSKKSSEAAAAREENLAALTASMQEYDLAIDLRRQRDTRFILLKVPARRYVGYATTDESLDAKLAVCLPAVPDEPFVVTKLNRTPISEQMLHLVDALPAEVNDYIRLPDLTLHSPQRPGSVAIFPKAGNDVKEWGDRNFRRLIDLLIADPKVSLVSVYTANPKDSEPYQAVSDPKVVVRQSLSYEDLLNSLSGHSVCVANNSFGAHLASYLGIQVIGIYAGHETVTEWAPIFGNASVVYTPVECSPCHIARREDCKADFKCLGDITPEYVYSAIESRLVGRATVLPTKTVDDVVDELLTAVAPQASRLHDGDRVRLADCVARSIYKRRKKKLFVDVSELIRHDAKTGIQRVSRSILKVLLEEEPAEYAVVPVYATVDCPGYRQATEFGAQIVGRPYFEGDGEFIDYQIGDVFLGLDLQPVVVPAQREYLHEMRNHGVRVLFVIYDILFYSLPHCFDSGLVAALQRWLEVVAECDGAICISQAVAAELDAWLELGRVKRERRFDISWFHLGADIENSCPTKGVPVDAGAVLSRMNNTTTFLAVGTLEPRKGHGQILDAFDTLWCRGDDLSLVIVGKEGWNVNSMCKRIRSHPEFGHRLLWLEAISDEYLEKIYTAADCLVAASEGEGFGLPLIEAARYKLPIFARDIPVFREVAGANGAYFSATTGGEMAAGLDAWIELYKRGEHPKSDGIPILTWRQSAHQLVDRILELGAADRCDAIETRAGGPGE